jgi:hypothetical protein
MMNQTQQAEKVGLILDSIGFGHEVVLTSVPQYGDPGSSTVLAINVINVPEEAITDVEDSVCRLLAGHLDLWPRHVFVFTPDDPDSQDQEGGFLSRYTPASRVRVEATHFKFTWWMDFEDISCPDSAFVAPPFEEGWESHSAKPFAKRVKGSAEALDYLTAPVQPPQPASLSGTVALAA